MSFEVRNEQAEAMLKEIGQLLRSACPEGYGFSLLRETVMTANAAIALNGTSLT